MRSIILEELRPEEISAIDSYLKKYAISSNLEGLYWLNLERKYLTELQKQLESQAGPYKISIELGHSSVKFELLIRADIITNEGGGTASQEQLAFIYSFIDNMARTLDLTTCL
jgi:hypothetical protein